MDYYFCQRHIIELFCPCSGLYTFVKRILRYSSFDEYNFKRHLVLQQVHYYKTERDHLNPKYNSFFEQKYKTILKKLNGDLTPKKVNGIIQDGYMGTNGATCSNILKPL